MNVLIIKLNATGDVVRTTPLLSCLTGEITWVTARNNLGLLHRLAGNLRSASWEDREIARDREYDLVINLEDDAECASFLTSVSYRQLFGAYVDANGGLAYSEDSRSWFDLSLISVYGRKQADQLKLRNRRTYQEMIFEGLGFRFGGERYLLPEALPTDLTGDVAIAPVAGAVWPMKNWAYYKELIRELEARGLKVNVLPRRTSLLEHLGDVQNHRCVVGGDSLPMHFALGSGTPCVNLFTCTSPWEIYDYGIQTKIVSPLLAEFFYRRDFDPRATTAIHLGEVLDATIDKLQAYEVSTSGLSHDGV
ncbi:MAG: heptosyltransferase [Verrucomicrobiota bacterium]|jgi:ADP-heptose:LPS heptosyltransferase